jgi:YD repeat-containing protein
MALHSPSGTWNSVRHMTDVTGTTTWGYDAASRVTSVAAPQGGVSYSYNPDGSRASMTLLARLIMLAAQPE